MVKIEYIGWRPNHIDAYAGMTWDKTGATNDVAGRHAEQMLRRHPDVYRLAPDQDIDASSEEMADDVARDEEEAQRDDIEDHIHLEQVNRMEKPQLIEFMQAKFGRKMDARLSVAKLREAAVIAVNQYGVAR